MIAEAKQLLEDPIRFQRLCWPHIRLYDKQVEILESVRDNEETIVPAGNDLGKDFTAGLCALWFFCSRTPCRVITTSSGQSQLFSVLWGEMRRFLATTEIPLPLHVLHTAIYYKLEDGTLEPRSYLKGLVTNEPENLQGHHIEWGKDGKPRTLCVLDEASAIDDIFYDAVDTWAHRKLIIGNPLPCECFFKRLTKGGDVRNEQDNNYHRKVIHISGDASPNVRLAREEEKLGKEPSYTELIPGVLNYREYQRRTNLWDKIRKHIGLYGLFYEGSEVLLYPPEWLNASEARARELIAEGKPRRAKSMGIDAAEGGDYTVWTVVDEFGVLYQLSIRTEDTNDIPGRTIAIGQRFNIPPEHWVFDRGGGGKQHADRLRGIRDKDGRQLYNVRTVGFGEGPSDAKTALYMQHFLMSKAEVREDDEVHYVYRNRRAEMYGLLRGLLDPTYRAQPFAIPEELTELRKQLAPLPLLYDNEGQMYLPPKGNRSAVENKRTKAQETIYDLLGRSPDEADSLVLAIYDMIKRVSVPKVGAAA